MSHLNPARIRVARSISSLMLPFLVLAASADPIQLHVGASDPEVEGWTLDAAGVAVGETVPGSETTNSGLHEFWKINDLHAEGPTRYIQNVSFLDAPDVGWSFETRIRIVDSPIVDFPGFSIGGTTALIADGHHAWGFNFGNDVAGQNNAGLGYVFSAPVDTRTDFVTYRIELSKNCPGHEDDTADYYIDGQLVMEGLGRTQLQPLNDSLVYMGGVSIAGTSDAHYELIQIELDLSPDSDGDGIDNAMDNCLHMPNPAQNDTDGDGFGNFCDADLNNDGVTNALDLAVIKGVFFSNDADADLNGDGQVNALDLGRMKTVFFEPPGPSCVLPTNRL